ncbi:hypothetical protein OVN20_06545 [Microcella daejeonensis]|uniref:hypothetical protein n=1 Tax=Microcella daejeonensis TaxID=2994971 RepID=UPI00226E1E5A|nr:hypothetical protein [Microcella daejeonensis]WAB85199.1 hypothetical protein OVN20_06545 [Microcella daejeonensis]
MTTMTTAVGKDRRTLALSLRYTAIAAAGIALVWMMRFKTVACSVSTSACSEDARLAPALDATAVLLIALAVVLALTVLSPASHRMGPSRAITVGLIASALGAAVVVMVSAGFTLWPIWA